MKSLLISCKFLFLLALFALIIHGEYSFAGATNELQLEMKKAEAAVQTLLNFSDYDEMNGLVKQWAEITSPAFRECLFTALWLQMKSKQALRLEGLNKPEKHDLLIAGGRCTWALEKLLDRELPSVTRASTDLELSDASRAAFNEFKAALERATPAVDLATLNSDEKLKMAESPNTPKNVLAGLSGDGDVRIRRAVAVNPMTPVQVLAELARTDVDADVRKNALKNLEVSRVPFNNEK